MNDTTSPDQIDLQAEVFRRGLDAGAVYVHCNTAQFYHDELPWDIVIKFKSDKDAARFARELKAAYPQMYSQAAYGAVTFRPKMRG